MSEMIDHLRALGYAALHPETALPEGYLEGLEAALGCRLPDDYREFVREFPLTGACPEDMLIDAEGVELAWSTLFGHDRKPTWGLVFFNDYYLDHKVEDMIVIGDDALGNLFYMGVNGTSGIYFKDRDSSDTMTREEMAFVRPSFEAFVLDSHAE